MSNERQKKATADRIASVERRLDELESTEGKTHGWLTARYHLAHARKEWSNGNYGVAELDLDDCQRYLNMSDRDRQLEHSKDVLFSEEAERGLFSD